MPPALELPGDHRVVEALARLGLAAVTVIGPARLRERLGGEPGAVEAREVEVLAGMLAG